MFSLHRHSDQDPCRRVRPEASERLIAMEEEVALLHGRFETELSRQATKAAEAAKQAQAALNGPLAKRTDRTKTASRAGAGGKTSSAADQKSADAGTGAAEAAAPGANGGRKNGTVAHTRGAEGMHAPVHGQGQVSERVNHLAPERIPSLLDLFLFTSGVHRLADRML